MPNTYKQVLKRKRKLLAEAPTKARNAAGIAFTARVVPRTPVDTGRARGNWQAGAGSPNTETDDNSLDPNATKTPQRIRREIARLPKGGSLFISNHLPYARRLENGHSKQAPAGFMTITAAEVAYLAPAFLMAALGEQGTVTGFVTMELEDE